MFRLLALLSLLGALAAAAGAAGPPNLVHNPSLEEPVTGLPEGWEGFQKPENAYHFKVVDGGHSGAKSMSIEGAGEYGVLSLGRARYEPGKQYAARGWVKVEGEAATLATVKLDYFSEN